MLFNWAWHTGMLRSSEERDLIMSLEDRLAIYRQSGDLAFAARPTLERDFAVRTVEDQGGLAAVGVILILLRVLDEAVV